MNNIPSFVRPGGKAYVNPEGIIYGTDGKLRWAYQFDQRKKPTLLLAMLRKDVSLCVAVGVLILLLKISTDGLAALRSSLPVLLGLIAVGALVAVASFGLHLLQDGPLVCLLFTMDEHTLSCQQVKGRADKETVTHAFAAWVGGQSQPSLRVCGLRTVKLSDVTAVVADPGRQRIRLRGGKGLNTVFAEPQQIPVVLDYLQQHGSQVK